MFASLADFYRDHRDLIADAAATKRHRAELTSVQKELTRITTAVNRYLAAFENDTLNPALLQERLASLQVKPLQLQTHRDELTDLLDPAPAAPADTELDALADHIDEILDHGTPAQRKALIEQLVADINIVGPGKIRPTYYRVPQKRETDDANPADDEPTVRTMGNLVSR